MKGFNEMLLGDIVTFQRGFDITKKEQTEGPIPIVSSSGISSFHNLSKVKAPGVVIGRKGTLGTVHYLKQDFWPHDTTLWVKDFKGNDPRFVSYFLKTLKLEIFDTGSSNPTLNRNHLHKIKVRFPDLDIQIKIANFISAYDDLRDNYCSQITEISSIIDELFKEWFVRFRFPNFQNAEFTKGIPTNWNIKSILDLPGIQLIKPNLEIFEGDKKYYATAQLDGIKLLAPTAIVTHNEKPSRAQYIPVKNSIWFARMKNTFKVLAVSENCADFINTSILSSGFVGFKADDTSFPFLYCLIRSKLFHDTKDVYCTGATQESLTNGGLKHVKVLIPEADLIEGFSALVAPLIKQLIQIRSLENAVEKQKEALLLRMLSGKIDLESLSQQH